MDELVNFNNQQIEALQSRIAVLETVLIEVCNKDCQQEYREIILKEVILKKKVNYEYIR